VSAQFGVITLERKRIFARNRNKTDLRPWPFTSRCKHGKLTCVGDCAWPH